jgi:hypothetical protein
LPPAAPRASLIVEDVIYGDKEEDGIEENQRCKQAEPRHGQTRLAG